MRNLKKVLSLALALVMLIGMMVIGAGAVETKFVDDGKIGDNYKEAVAVMSAIKVLGGKENNNFDPQGTLTRAEAAKILCVMTMGADAAEGLAGVNKSGVFTDMADHWAAGYVDACYNKGIVLGMDVGIYGPSNTLTGTQFAAMLLRAIGVEGEFTGPSWESAVIAAAAKAKLSEMTTKPIAREAASKMAFDGLQYSPSGSKSYTVGNQSFDDFFEAYIYAQNNGGKIEITTAKDSLASTVFGLKKADQSANGRNGYTWQLDNKDITGFMPTDGVLYVSTDGTTLANIDVKADDSVKYFLNGAESTKATVEAKILRGNELTLVDVDGDDKYDKVLVIEKTLKTAASDPVEKNEKVSITGVLTKATDVDLVSGWEDVEKGDKVLTYTMADKITYIEKLNTVTGEVTGRTGSGSTERTFFVDGTGYSVAKGDAATIKVFNDAMGSDDGVKMYLDADDNVWAAESAVVKPINYAVLLDIVWVKTVSAGSTSDGYAEAQFLLMDGTTVKYKVSKLNGATPTMADDAKTLTVLAGGKQITAGDTDLQTVINATGAGTGSDKVVGSNYYKVMTTLAAGKTDADLYVGVRDSSSEPENNDLEGKFYLYSNPDNNTVSLEEVGINVETGAAITANDEAKKADGGAKAYVKGEPSVGSASSVPVNNNTKFVIYNETSKKYEAYTGITGDDAMPSITSTTYKCVVKNGVATHVYVASATPTASTAEIIFITSAEYEYTASTKVYTYNAIVDGEETTVEVAKDLRDDITVANLYEVTRNNKDQIVSATAATVSGNVKTINATSVSKADAGTILVGSDNLAYNDESVVFYIDKDGVVSTGVVADVVADSSATDGTLNKAWAVVTTENGSATQTIETLYILTKDAATTPEGPVAGTTPISGTNVTYYEGNANTLNSTDAIKNLTPGLYTFKEMPAIIKDAGDDASKLMLFRWNNTAAASKTANIEILDSAGTVIWNGWTASLDAGPHYSYILINKPGADVLWGASDTGTFLADGNYTWRVTLEDGTTPVAQGSFSVKW